MGASAKIGFAFATARSLKGIATSLTFCYIRPAPDTTLAKTFRVVRRTQSCEETLRGNSIGFELTSKRRRGFPSETEVKRGERFVHGDKELIEKLGRNDLCPCGSRRRFQAMLPQQRPI